jgi:hypothetical protein
MQMQPDSKSGFALVKCEGATHGFACTPGSNGIDFHRISTPATGKAEISLGSFQMFIISLQYMQMDPILSSETEAYS